MARCAHCEVVEQLPYACKYCGQLHCASHRLPESHACSGLESYKQAIREKGYIMRPEPTETLRVQVKGPRLGDRFEDFLRRVSRPFNGSLSILFIVLMGLVWIAELFAVGVAGEGAIRWFGLGRDYVLQRPWTIVTAVFSHGSWSHLFVNGLFMVFFGPTLEGFMGQRRFAYLFLGAGILSGIVQAAISDVPVVGASGGLMALLGMLTILAPGLTVYFMFFLPVPIWLLTFFYALLDLSGTFAPGDGIAHLAHLTGLAIGLAYGWQWRKGGVMRRPPNEGPRYPGSRRVIYQQR